MCNFFQRTWGQLEVDMGSKRDCTTLWVRSSLRTIKLQKLHPLRKSLQLKNSCYVGEPVGTVIHTCPLSAFPCSASYELCWRQILGSMDIWHDPLWVSSYSNNTLVLCLSGVRRDLGCVLMAVGVRNFSSFPILGCYDTYLLIKQQMTTWSLPDHTCLAR